MGKGKNTTEAKSNAERIAEVKRALHDAHKDGDKAEVKRQEKKLLALAEEIAKSKSK